MASISRRELREIAGRAEPLWARLRRPAPARFDAGRGEARLERWCQRVTGGHRDLFDRRLALSGWDHEQCVRVLGAAANATGELPSWADTLIELSAAALDWGAAPPRSAPADIPFAPLLAPVVGEARRRVRLCPGVDTLLDAAWDALERHLFERLAAAATPTLYATFARAHPRAADVRGLLVGRVPPRTTARFDEFVRHHLEDGYRRLVLDYPVLGRLMATHVDHWVAACAELASRLTHDRPGQGRRRVVRLWTGLSDPHHGGRVVTALETEDGARFFYKPRSVEGEAIFERLIAWCNRNAPPPWLPLVAPSVRARHGYGWVDEVRARECPDIAAVRRYYRRLGQLLCLFHLLQSTDIHRENVVACGEHPVLIDAETLVQPRVPVGPAPGAPPDATRAPEAFLESVAQMGLLPAWEWNPAEHTPFDSSALGVDVASAPVRVPRLHHVNTDSMVLLHEFGTPPAATSVPCLDGRAMQGAEFSESLEQGFTATYRWLSSTRPGILDACGLGPAPTPFEPRFLFRATRIYHSVLQLALQPECLADGVDRSVELDRLSLPFLEGDTTTLARSIVSAELDALEQEDVPHFSVPADARGWGRHPEIFTTSARESAARAIERMGEVDLREQTAIIRGAFAAQGAHVQRDPLSADSGALPSARATPSALLEAAERIAAAIRSSVGRDGCSWLGIRQVSESDRYRFEPIGEDLYSGRAGVAVFLAALSAVTRSRADEDLITRALGLAAGGWKQGSASWRAAWIRSLGTGALHGIPSLAYALLSAGRLLGRADLERQAVDLAGILTADVLAADGDCTLAGGLAGALLVLVRLHERTADPGLLRSATFCGDLLLARRTAGDAAPRAWAFGSGEPLAGLYLGTSGIAYALARLGHVTGDARYLDAATEALEREDALFDPATRNWRDLRPARLHAGAAPSMAAWCHGAPGVALARLAVLDCRESERWRTDLDAAMTTTAECGVGRLDHLCCGNLGRVDVLWTCGTRLARPEWRDAALRTATCVLRRAEAAGGYGLTAGVVGVAEAPSLFRGSAGIGYGLLGLARPGDRRSLLLLE